MTDSNATPALKQAAQNPWYLLATLYGESVGWDEELQAKNRVAWNRYYALQLTDEQREVLKGRVSVAELVPFSDAELLEIRERFRRKAGGVQVEMPGADQRIDFSACQFDKDAFFDGYVLGNANFRSATFSGDANFSSATFSGDANFSRATFSGDANFSRATFSGDANFSSATFSGYTSFGSATFSGDASFRSATFSRDADFSSATFSGDADFSSAAISGYTSFSSATFSGDADFSSATFSGDADFSSATFSGYADFSSATFSGYVDFRSATFSGSADFRSATFSGSAYFRSATFSGSADFRSATFHQDARFTNSELKAPTNFENSRFLGAPPRFHGAKLHEDTVWRGVGWPPAPTDRSEAGRFTDAYERLKQEMDRLKKHEDELMFFAKELACRRVAAGWFKGLPIAAYGWFCGYGRSYLKPFVWMVVLFNVGVPALWLLQPNLGWGTAVGLSAVNCLAGLGIRKDLMGKVLDSLGPGALVVSGVQTVLGLILLFLIGLGLRNRFRMK